MSDPQPGSPEWEEQKLEHENHVKEWLAKGKCPYSGEGLQLEVWYGGPPTNTPYDSIACDFCDCFGFDPKDPRLRCNPKGGYHSTPHKGCLLR